PDNEQEKVQENAQDNIQANAQDTPPAEEIAADENSDTEITDPDDIDALLDSMNVNDSPVEKDTQPDNEQEKVQENAQDNIQANAQDTPPAEEIAADENSDTEITDPDDIDALLESMNIDVPDNINEIASAKDLVDTSETENSEADSLSAINENREKIESLTEAYIAPLLSTDFSDILAKSPEKESTNDELINEIENEEFDIDELIAEAEQSNENAIEEELDIGDDLLSGAFDEAALAKLLNEDEEGNEAEQPTELSPDFSDQNVLAGLLNDDEYRNEEISEANEINDIQELDNLNFDELLANIEEESSVANKAANFNQTTETVDDFTLDDFDNFNAAANTSNSFGEQNKDNGTEFVSVDSLLTASQDEVSFGEPYNKANIDVGLNEFPEFTKDINPIDVDLDENGIAAKLDLAKVYLEIGDEDNAEVILKEVIKLGDAHQQAEAEKLLKDL
ncbi:FimV/HubP family polar landmark protein, partial [Colwellia sp. E150_009]